jgi:hypothetical protein
MASGRSRVSCGSAYMSAGGTTLRRLEAGFDTILDFGETAAAREPVADG